MELRRIDSVEKDELYFILPEDVMFEYEMWEELLARTVVYVAEEGKEMLGAAVFVTYAFELSTANCIYVHVKEEHRKKGVATFLIRESASEMKRMGFEHVITESKDSSFKLIEPMLARLGFRELPPTYNVGYSIGAIKHSDVAERLAKTGLLSNVKRKEELGSISLRRFANEMKKRGYNCRFDEIDSKYSRFYVADGVITSCLLMNNCKDEVLFSIGYSAGNDAKSSNALALMLFSTIMEAQKTFSDDSGIIVEFYDKRNIAAMSSVFGEAIDVEEYSYWEM